MKPMKVLFFIEKLQSNINFQGVCNAQDFTKWPEKINISIVFIVSSDTLVE